MDEFQFNQRLYHKKFKRKKFGIIFILLLIIVLSVAAFYLTKPRYKNFEFFLVGFGDYSNYSQANECAIKLKEIGGAGYIVFDKSYFVVASVYSSLDDAEKVKNNINFQKNNVKVLKFNKNINKSQNFLKKSESNKFLKNLEIIKNLIENNQTIDQNFDKGELNFVNAKAKLKVNFEQLSSVVDSIKNQTSCLKGSALSNVYLDNIIECEKRLFESNNEQSFSILIKYQNSCMVENFFNFLSFF